MLQLLSPFTHTAGILTIHQGADSPGHAQPSEAFSEALPKLTIVTYNLPHPDQQSVLAGERHCPKAEPTIIMSTINSRTPGSHTKAGLL